VIDPRELLTDAGFRPQGDVTRMPGYDASVWRVSTESGVVAVRVLPADRDISHEVEMQQLAAGLGVPAPEVLRSGAYLGHPYTVTSWLPGRPLGELLAHGLSVRQGGELLGRAMAALHEPLHGGSVLCHLDFQPFNVLVTGDEITGIVDWSNARLGDARQDIAWTLVVMRLAPALMPGLADAVEPFLAAFRAGYAASRELPADDELRPFVLAAAQQQIDDWAPRIASGAAPQAVGAAARAALDAWREP